jgi:hypothetical protein
MVEKQKADGTFTDINAATQAIMTAREVEVEQSP